jgi:outer membrane receptor protein involved in Fe transport
MRHFTSVVLLTLAFSSIAAGQNTGAIHGVVTDPTGAVIASAAIVVQMDGTAIVRNSATDEQGRYQIVGLPFGRFSMRVTAAGFHPADSAGELSSSNSFLHDVRLEVERIADSTTVVQHLLIEADVSSSRHNFSALSISELPKLAPNRGMSSTLKTLPGVVEEENGRLHIRGSEVQPQYVLDGVPIADNLSGIFGTELDTEDMQVVEVFTGNIPAQFGGNTSAVVNVSTKSGLDTPWHGRVRLSAGSFKTRSGETQFSGRVGRLGIFGSADTTHTRRFLDPPEAADDDEGVQKDEDEAEERSIHNGGGIVRLFTRFDWRRSDRDVFRLSLSTSGANLQVPNSAESQASGQDQRQELRDDFQSLAWNHTFDPKTVLDIALSRRSSLSHLLDPLKTGFPFYAAQNRRQRTEGIHGNLSRAWTRANLLVGGEIYRHPIHEEFRAALADIEDPDDMNEPIARYTVAAPFVFDEKKTGTRSAIFAQSRLHLSRRLSADVGLRFDRYRIVAHKNGVTPRVGIAYYLSRTNTVLRAAYNRLFHTPPLENLLLSSMPTAGVLSRGADPMTTRIVLPERQNHYEFGFQQQLGQHLRVDAVRYIKNIRNFSDEEQLLTSGIIFPVSIAKADIRGTELRLDLLDLRGVKAYASYANARANITTPITGGLFLNDEEDGEEAVFAIPGVNLPADQDERNEIHFGTTYLHKSGTWVGLSGRFDSGLPTHFDVSEYATFDPTIRAQLDPIRQRIKPRTILNIAGGIKLFRDSPNPLSLQLSVNNLFDRFYLYNFRSAFSGTHLGRPREVTLGVTLDWPR